MGGEPSWRHSNPARAMRQSRLQLRLHKTISELSTVVIRTTRVVKQGRLRVAGAGPVGAVRIGLAEAQRCLRACASMPGQEHPAVADVSDVLPDGRRGFIAFRQHREHSAGLRPELR